MKILPALCLFGLAITLLAQQSALSMMPPIEAQPLAHFVTSGDWPLKWVAQTFTEEDQLKEVVLQNRSSRIITGFQLGWVVFIPDGCGFPEAEAPRRETHVAQFEDRRVGPGEAVTVGPYHLSSESIRASARHTGSPVVVAQIGLSRVRYSDGGETFSAFERLGAFGPEPSKSPCQATRNQKANAPHAFPGPQSLYSSKYGISVGVPALYQLKVGELGQEVGLGYLGPIPMEFVAVGGVRAATVVMPPHSYPNTDFNTAFVTVSVNQYLTPYECEQFPHSIAAFPGRITKKIGGLDFQGLKQGDAGLGHEFGGIYYHAFSEGFCYEVGEGIATSGYGAVDGMEKVDEGHVFANLDNIIRSIRIDPPKSGVAASPSIQSLALSPLLQHSPGAYRLSWNIKGAKDDQVWLSASCSGDLSIFEITADTPEGAMFSCGVLRPAKSASGSLNLEFKNIPGGRIKETLRLFAAGQPPASRTITIDLPPLPLITTLVANGRKYATPSTGTPMQIIAGHKVEIGGVAFLPHQTLWIGSTSLPVTSINNRSINFPVPKSLREGPYPLFIANERGRSNAVTVQILK
jgi:hypothetical protein